MRLQYFLAGFIPSVFSLSLPHLDQRQANSCGVVGYDKVSNANYFEANATVANKAACGSMCKQHEPCRSYAFGKGECLHYSRPV